MNGGSLSVVDATEVLPLTGNRRGRPDTMAEEVVDGGAHHARLRSDLEKSRIADATDIGEGLKRSSFHQRFTTGASSYDPSPRRAGFSGALSGLTLAFSGERSESAAMLR